MVDMANGQWPGYGAPAEADHARPESGKRKYTDGHGDPCVGRVPGDAVNEIAEHCRKFVAPSTPTAAPGGEAPAAFYPLPPELNQAVLSSLGIGGSQPRGPASATSSARALDALTNHALDGKLPPSPAGLMQPFLGTLAPAHPARSHAHTHAEMDHGTYRSHASTSHGPQCQSIPKLSVQYHGGTASQLWALCPDCGAFSKVQQDEPAMLCYSP